MDQFRRKTLKYLKPMTDFSTMTFDEKSIKRVLSPYIRIPQKPMKAKIRAPQFSFFLTPQSEELLKTMSMAIETGAELAVLLYETVRILKEVTHSLGGRLYMVDESTGQLYLYQHHVPYERCRVNYELAETDTLAQYVAKNKEYVLLDDVTQDARFANGVSYKDNVKAVLCVPIVAEDKCYAVVEFYRERDQAPYDKLDMKITVLVCGWVALAVHQHMDGLMLHKKQEIVEDMLYLVLCYYSKKLSFEELIGEILNYAKHQLKAEKAAFYVFSDVKNGSRHAEVYQEGITDTKTFIKKKLKIRFGKEKTVPCFVAETGTMLNVHDVYNDPRFDNEIYMENNIKVINRTELCTPIDKQEGIDTLGVLSLINKRDSTYFTAADEHFIQIIAKFCALAVHHRNALERHRIAELHVTEVTELLLYHMRPCTHSIEAFDDEEFPIPKNLNEFSWCIHSEDTHLIPKIILYMMKELIPEECIDIDEMKRFILTIQSAYKVRAYHNFMHAFYVFHCAYCILARNKDVFSVTDMEAIIVATLAHDVDHFGINNYHFSLTDHYLAQLYEEATLEKHHCYVTALILQNYRIFTNITAEDYPKFLDDVVWCIMATDMMTYFKVRSKLTALIDKKEVDLKQATHIKWLKAVVMSVCDCCFSYKSFSNSRGFTNQLYREFYQQGDIERGMGLIPLSMMDREKEDYVPSDQLHFITLIVLPAVGLLNSILPNTAQIFYNADIIKESWRVIMKLKGEKIWRQVDSIVE